MTKAQDSAALLELVQRVAPGFYTERDGGDWYIVAPTHYRIAEGFCRRDDARRCLAWLAGGPMPKGWGVTHANTLAADLECGQDYDATLWIRDVAKAFPDFSINAA